MSGRLPAVGTLVVVRAGGRAYSSVVQDVREGELALLHPGEPDAPYALVPGAEVDVVYHDPAALYRLTARVARREAGSVPLLWLRGPWHVVRVQRREHVRLDIALPVTAEAGGERVRGRTLDISGGGIKAVFERPLPLGETVWLELQLPEGPVRAEGRVLRAAGEHEGKPGFAIHFTGIADADREAIYRLIFRETRERRRRGLPMR